MGDYDVAEICLNGHLVTASAMSSPELKQNFCDRCGAQTIMNCPNCKERIRGRYHSRGIVSVGSISIPSFCIKCGAPFPWTESKLAAAKELLGEQEGLKKEERAMLEKSLDDIIRDTPGTPVAALRLKKFFIKASKGTSSALRDIVCEEGSARPMTT